MYIRNDLTYKIRNDLCISDSDREILTIELFAKSIIYKNYKNFFEELKKKFQQNYYLNLLEKHKGSAKQRWKVLKEIIGKVQKKNQSLSTSLETKNIIISDKNVISLPNKIPQVSKKFNQYFSLLILK